jgi:hypothetical protein
MFMGGTIGRMRRRRPASWLVLSTSLIVLSSFVIVAGAQVASAAQCGRGQAVCHLNFFTEPHRAGRFQTITNQDLNPTIDPSLGVLPPIVEVLDENGVRDTTFAGQIMVYVSYPSPSPGVLSGHTTVNAMNGAASFSDLSLDVAADYQLTAVALTGTGIAPVISATFRIEYSVCDAGQTCEAPFHDLGQTLSEVSMAYTGSGRGAVSHGTDGISSCTVPGVFTDPFFHGPAEWSAIEVLPTGTTQATRTGDTNQLIVHQIFKRWRQMILDKGSNSYRECVTSPVAFVTWNGSPLTQDPLTGKYTGLPADCSKTNTGLCQAFVKSTKAGDILEGISAPPSSLAPDPRGN